MDLSPRAVIAGRYRVDTRVGAGGMGEVWAGEAISVGVRVAIKTLLPAAALNHEVIARFKREAVLLGRIRSDHVARVVDFVTDDVYGLVLVMELVEGDPLSRILQDKPMTVEETIDLGVGIASALLDLHRIKIIHRDLKPGNIIMAPLPGGKRRAVVVDFGVSRVMTDKDGDEDEELTGITRADMAVGTIEYMAPEQILNSRNVTPGSDIYAAGAILFRACAGRHVYGNVTSDAELAQKKLTTESPPLPLTRTDKIAQGLAKVTGKMLKRRPSERYKSAEEVLADLLPLRDLANAAASEIDAPTIDAAAGLKMPATLTVPMPASQVAGAAAAVAANGRAALVAAAAPPPAASDSSVSVTAPPLAKTAAPRRGIPPIVTLGLVAAALAGGVLLGPRLMAPSAAIVEPTPAAGLVPLPTATASPPTPVVLEPVPSASASAAAAPALSASASASSAGSAAAAPSPSVTASASASAAPGEAAVAPVKPAPPIRVPGPLPARAPALVAPAPTAPKATPDGI